MSCWWSFKEIFPHTFEGVGQKILQWEFSIKVYIYIVLEYQLTFFQNAYLPVEHWSCCMDYVATRPQISELKIYVISEIDTGISGFTWGVRMGRGVKSR